MITGKTENKSFTNTCLFATVMSVCLIAASLLIYFFLPESADENVDFAPITIVDLSEENEEELSAAFQDYFAEVSLTRMTDSRDSGLLLYRQTLSRSAVEWFYTQITGSKDVTQAILIEADNNEIPLALAFALAHTESNYKANATNRNANATIDRGLFQLNSNSFPSLSEADFFDPFVSSKYGMAHLKFCLNTAGNEVSALAMYNAGTGRVRSNKTPQSTLNYIGRIMSYQKMLEQLFDEQVAVYYETKLAPELTTAVAYAKQ